MRDMKNIDMQTTKFDLLMQTRNKILELTNIFC